MKAIFSSKFRLQGVQTLTDYGGVTADKSSITAVTPQQVTPLPRYYRCPHYRAAVYTVLVPVCAGTSDPYVKFKVAGKTCYRSRTVMKNLNPRWDEKFTLMLDDLGKTIDVRVYDYDRGLRDDSMGAATIQPSELPYNVSVSFFIRLIQHCQNATCYNDMDRTVKKHEVIDC